MTKQARRRLIPILVLLAAASVLLVIIYGEKRASKSTQQVEAPVTEVVSQDEAIETKKETVTEPTKDVVPEEQPKSEERVDLPTPTDISPFEILRIQQHEMGN